MRRREFMALLWAAWPLSAWGQQTSKIPRVGVLSPGNPPPHDPFRQAERFELGLRELGWQPSNTILIEYRYAEGRLDRLPSMAVELVRWPADVIIARGQTVTAARDATKTIGIVMAADPDPVGNGFVRSLARPAGNITGFSTQAFELEGKQLGLLCQAVPSLTRVAILTSSTTIAISREQLEQRRAAAQALRIEVIDVPISDGTQLQRAFSKMKEERVGAVLISGTLWFLNASAAAQLAIEQRLATITNLREFAAAGALMTYGVSFGEIHRRSAVYVDRIIKGASPAEIPVEQPTKFDLVINFKTAKILGLELSPTLLATADEVIE